MKNKGILLILLLYWCACLVMFWTKGTFFYLMMGWNVLLAVLPLLFIQAASSALEANKRLSPALYTMLWLFFLPNAPYMITDFIHVAGDRFKTVISLSSYPTHNAVVYSSDILLWSKLLLIGFGCVFAVLTGMESLQVFEQNLRKSFSSLVVLLLLGGAILLSSIGVYIGRFLRFNSWDIVTDPVRLIQQTTSQLNLFTLQFILAFTLFTTGCYAIYGIFIKPRSI